MSSINARYCLSWSIFAANVKSSLDSTPPRRAVILSETKWSEGSPLSQRRFFPLDFAQGQNDSGGLARDKFSCPT